MHDVRLNAGTPFDQIYAPIFVVLACLLAVGFVANFLVKPVSGKYHMTEAELQQERQLAHEKMQNGQASDATTVSQKSSQQLVILAWVLVLIPIGYGVWSTLQKAWVLIS